MWNSEVSELRELAEIRQCGLSWHLWILCSTLESECTAVAAIQLRMRMRILTRPENSLANFKDQTSKKKLRIRRCEGIR